MPHRCPTCGDSFGTLQGVRIHHSLVHDERLPNQECDHCGTEFHSTYEKAYCSDGCRERSVSFEGEDNPNYRGARESTECDRCGAEFEYYPSEKDGVYCPDCVEAGDWRSPPALSGEDSPSWSGGKRVLECDVCGDEFRHYPSEIGDGATLCGEDCRAAWLSETYSGPGHPNWKGGGSTRYGQGWNRTRQAALERDDHRCVVCGAGRDELGRNPDVHHIIPVRAFERSDRHDERDAHRLENVVTLCVGCHRGADFGHVSRARLRFLAGIDPPHLADTG